MNRFKWCTVIVESYLFLMKRVKTTTEFLTFGLKFEKTTAADFLIEISIVSFYVPVINILGGFFIVSAALSLFF